jgi:hypothetical protein
VCERGKGARGKKIELVGKQFSMHTTRMCLALFNGKFMDGFNTRKLK